MGKPAPNGVADVKARFAAVRSSPEAAEYIQAIRETRLVESVLAHELQFDWSRVQLLYDPPGKTLEEAEKKDLLLADLKHAVGEPQRELDIVSPYFVPGKAGTKTLSAYPGEWDQAAHRHQLVCGDGCRLGPYRIREEP